MMRSTAQLQLFDLAVISGGRAARQMGFAALRPSGGLTGGGLLREWKV
jgi:hypothetical protein